MDTWQIVSDTEIFVTLYKPANWFYMSFLLVSII